MLPGPMPPTEPSLEPDKELLPESKSAKRRKRNVRISRDVVLFAVGVVGILHETFISHTERPSLLILFAALCGLPLYLRRNGL